ncbi:hypothetical protein WS71_21095 [Burkholderia mayonis]|uniref:Uncharacterized protein n=1 Tax=Burkholderia mayonis TaxID=1385591 RepID=A0A1B4G1I3_9BURK|nr:hypothetical protein WS71_21095 [Burkholderia mayonis]KVE49294.1 hypothetical protein WS71_16160 [Burkholderia mayonis]
MVSVDVAAKTGDIAMLFLFPFARTMRVRACIRASSRPASRDSTDRAGAIAQATFASLGGSPISKFDMISSARTIAE